MSSIEIPPTVQTWAEEFAGKARLDFAVEEHGWWIKAKPHAKGAVGFTLGVSDRDEYDLFLGNGLRHEAWPWPDGLDPADLCSAISAGRVRAEISIWRGWELRRMVVIDCPPEIWTDLNVGLLDLLVPASWRSQKTEQAAAY